MKSCEKDPTSSLADEPSATSPPPSDSHSKEGHGFHKQRWKGTPSKYGLYAFLGLEKPTLHPVLLGGCGQIHLQELLTFTSTLQSNGQILPVP